MLFEEVGPSGFQYCANFLTEKEEADLIAIISDIQLHTFIFHGYAAKRLVRSYGFDYNFDSRTVARGEPIPPAFCPLIDKVAAWLHIPPLNFKELLVSEYPPASVINWHRDAAPFDIVVGISMLSDCIFRLRPCDKSAQRRGATISIPVTRRSVYLLQGESRSAWEHSILSVASRRYSITLRTLRA